ncbi:MAG: DNA-3-methyladenine glycosylase 2 family protein [Deltaproteobacteria bacterium]|nr:DNA-3-methyladenine glycosylase 2 family protein [Deltaproteobacteria bacterium]
MTPESIVELNKLDKTLGKLIKKVGPMKLKPQVKQSPYQALVEAVIYQQLTGKAAATILGRVKALFPKKKFPKPIDLLETPDDALRTAGLSRAKTAALKDIASKTLNGTVPTTRLISKMNDEEIIEKLTSIRGVGRWTVEMLLIFKLGRPDVLPATDYGIRKGFALTYGKKQLPQPKELLEFGLRWKPHRTTACWYLWRSLDL